MTSKYFRFILSFASIAVFLVCTSSVLAAITVDNSSSSGVSEPIIGVPSLTFPHTVNSCTNCVLYIKIATYTQANVSTARVNTANITYAGQNLTAVGTQVSPFPTPPATGNSSVEIFRLINPPVGMGDVVVNFLVPVNYTVGAAISLNGVNQTTPDASLTPLSGNALSFMTTVSPTLPGDLVLDSLASSPNAIFLTEDPGQTVCADDMDETTCLRGRRFFGGSFDVGSNSRKFATAAATPMSWSLTIAQSYAYIGFAVKQFVITAATASVSGQITSPEGAPLGKVFVTLQNLQTGEEFRTRTNRKGAYRFENLETAHLYQIRVFSPNYDFSPDSQVFTLNDSQENVNFTGSSNYRQR